MASPQGAESSVELLERGVVADPEGSSYGDSRMYREMQSDPFYSRMQARTRNRSENVLRLRKSCDAQ